MSSTFELSAKWSGRIERCRSCVLENERRVTVPDSKQYSKQVFWNLFKIKNRKPLMCRALCWAHDKRSSSDTGTEKSIAQKQVASSFTWASTFWDLLRTLCSPLMNFSQASVEPSVLTPKFPILPRHRFQTAETKTPLLTIGPSARRSAAHTECSLVQVNE